MGRRPADSCWATSSATPLGQSPTPQVRLQHRELGPGPARAAACHSDVQAQAGDQTRRRSGSSRNAYAGAHSRSSPASARRCVASRRGRHARSAAGAAGHRAQAFPGDQQMLQLQEQQAAQAMLAQLLQQQHQQDIGQATAMAGTRSATGVSSRGLPKGFMGGMQETGRLTGGADRARWGSMIDQKRGLTRLVNNARSTDHHRFSRLMGWAAVAVAAATGRERRQWDHAKSSPRDRQPVRQRPTRSRPPN